MRLATVLGSIALTVCMVAVVILAGIAMLGVLGRFIVWAWCVGFSC